MSVPPNFLLTVGDAHRTCIILALTQTNDLACGEKTAELMVDAFDAGFGAERTAL